jgi:hypothetical protein
MYDYDESDAAAEGTQFDPRADGDPRGWSDDRANDIDLSGGGAVWCPAHEAWEARAVMCP